MTNRHSEAAVPAGEEPALPQEDKTPPENAPDEKHTRRRRKGSWGNTINWDDEECQWTELIAHLPETVRIIWRTIGDMRQFWRLLHAFGGQSTRGRSFPLCMMPIWLAASCSRVPMSNRPRKLG